MKKNTSIAIVGDSAAEEDYVLSSIGWAATKNLPILFIVEDNNLSILTKKKVRRSWEMHNVSSAFGVEVMIFPMIRRNQRLFKKTI
ncbi:MAG: hypothetical protein CM15mP93_17070 [Thiotrichaceae bacterium]|nr:MAG: hypothetical protein CM15mP93_17070 [Thiotrichaceae bacterium]